MNWCLTGCLYFAPEGRLGFPRGEAVVQIGSSEPIWVTDEECGQKTVRINMVGTYYGLSAEKKYQPSPKSKCSRPSSSSVSPLRASHLPPGGRKGAFGANTSANSNLSDNRAKPASTFLFQHLPPVPGAEIPVDSGAPGAYNGGNIRKRRPPMEKQSADFSSVSLAS